MSASFGCAGNDLFGKTIQISLEVVEGVELLELASIQRGDADALALARDVDPAYGLAFDAATRAGVEAIALRCRMSLTEIVVDRAVPLSP